MLRPSSPASDVEDSPLVNFLKVAAGLHAGEQARGVPNLNEDRTGANKYDVMDNNQAGKWKSPVNPDANQPWPAK